MMLLVGEELFAGSDARIGPKRRFRFVRASAVLELQDDVAADRDLAAFCSKSRSGTCLDEIERGRAVQGRVVTNLRPEDHSLEIGNARGDGRRDVEAGRQLEIGRRRL